MFVTRQMVLIVPAAPCCDSISTVAVLSRQRGVLDFDVLVDSPETDVEPVEVDCGGPCPVGTGPASFAPLPPHPPATRTTVVAAARRVLVMRPIVRAVRNPVRPPR